MNQATAAWHSTALRTWPAAPIVGGNGGGRPDFAEAGGKDASKIAELLAASRGVIEKLLA